MDTDQQKIGETVDLTGFNFSKSGHPVACMFHLLFKALAAFTYFIRRKTTIDTYLWDYSLNQL